MKRRISAFLAFALIVGLFVTAVGAATDYQSSDVTIGTSNEVRMVGSIVPSIMSVTMPTYVPFDVSRNVQTENKVVSPRITMTNNSYVPVYVVAYDTVVDLSNLPGTSWATSRYVGANQVAIGFKNETQPNQMPENLDQTTWLNRYGYSGTVMSLDANEAGSMYVVGALGNSVPENKTFTVIPTLVAHQAR